jgi:hypothetical protein
MKQILQSLKKGTTEIANVPYPALKRWQGLIRSIHTLVSSDTERMNELFLRSENWLNGSGHHQTGERHREYRQSD